MDGGWNMGGMWIWWFLGVALIAGVGWTFLRSSRGSMKASSESPEQILKRRYAQGEFDRETYERMLQDLKS